MSSPFTGGGGAANSGFIYMALQALEQRKMALVNSSVAAPKSRLCGAASVFREQDRICASAGGKSSAHFIYYTFTGFRAKRSLADLR